MKKLILFGVAIVFVLAIAPIMLANGENDTENQIYIPTSSPVTEEVVTPSEWFVVDGESTEEPTEEPTEVPTELPTNSETTPTYPELTETVTWYSDYRVYTTNQITTLAGGAEIDIDFFAKLLYCEAGGMTWEGQVYTASAILNFCDRYKISMWEAGHNKNMFSVAPYVDEASPKTRQYEVIEYVLGGGRIGEICHFRTKHYHTFGTPICKVDGHYFSIA